jgi:uncharacterized membrane protein AbrB (regulator of aidB expression)
MLQRLHAGGGERHHRLVGSFAWLSIYGGRDRGHLGLLSAPCQYDSVTAYFSAAPGGLNEMILAGGALGGDERRISMSHAARILIAIFALSFGYRWFGGYVPTGTAGSARSAMDWLDWLLLTGCGVVGFAAARALRIPAYALVGPMLLSAIVHAIGIPVAAAGLAGGGSPGRVGAMVGSRSTARRRAWSARR